MERSHEHHDDDDSSANKRPYRGRDAGAMHVPLHLDMFERRSSSKAESDDEDEEGDDDDNKPKRPLQTAAVLERTVELPKPAASVHHLEQFGVLPPVELPVAEQPHEAEHQEETEDNGEQAEELLAEMHRPMNATELWARFGTKTETEPPAAPPIVEANEVILEAAAETVDPNAPPQYAARHAAPTPQPVTRNTTPFANQAPPTPNTPPPTPPGNHPPTQPNVLPPNPNGPPTPPFGPGPHNPNLPPFGPVNHFNVAPTPNVAPTLHTHTVERHETVIQKPNMLAGLALVAVLWEASRRKKGDARLEAALKKQKAELETMRNEQSLAAAVRTRHEAASPRIAQPNVAVPSMRQPERPMAPPQPEWQRATQPVRPAEVRPRAPERPAVATALFGPEQPSQPAVEQELQSPDARAFELQPDQHIQRSAWHNIVVDSRGREVVDAIQYGQGFQQERQREAAPQVPKDTGVAVGSIIGSTAVQTSAPQIHAVNPSLPSGKNMPSLPLGQPTTQDLQHRLPAPRHPVRDTFITVVLWLLVALFAFAVVSGVRLLF